MTGDDFLAFLGIVRALARVHEDVETALVIGRFDRAPDVKALLTMRDHAEIKRWDATHDRRARELGAAMSPFVRLVPDADLMAFANRVWRRGTYA